MVNATDLDKINTTQISSACKTNKDLSNINLMCQANNTFSVLSVTNNTLKVYHQNICGLKCRTNE
jgi:hypothetical protein